MSRVFRQFLVIALITLSSEALSASPPAERTFRISGTVVDAVDGNVLPDIDVSIALTESETLLQTVTSGRDGRFEFAGLAAAKYALIARGRGYLQQGYEQHHSAFTAIVTGPGLVTEDLTFKLKPESAISGTVTDEFNDPVNAAEVLLFVTDPTESRTAIALIRKVTTDDSGVFLIGHLHDVSYYLAVVAHPWYARNEQEEDDNQEETGETSSLVERTNTGGNAVSENHHHSPFDVTFQTTYYPSTTDPGQATPITLTPGQRAKVDLSLSAVPALRLKIRGNANAAGSLNLSEQIFSYSRQVARQGIGPEGTELNGLAPGRYLAEYSAQPTGQPVQQPLELFADTEIAPGEGSKIASTVVGTILLGSKEPCLRCTIRLINLPSYERIDAQNTAKGFEIQGGVRPGRYLVLVSTEDYLIKDIVSVGADVIGTELEIPAGVKVQLAVNMTKDVGTIHGVVLRDGKPVSQAAVFLVPDHDPARSRMLFRRDQSDSDGTFTLRGVLPGAYRVVAVAEGWDLEWTNPAILKSYLSSAIKIRVEGTGKYEVQVTEQPLEGASR